MLQETDLPTPYLVGAEFHLTNKCNFACAHCLRGYPGNDEFTRENFQIALRAINSPSFDLLHLGGSEARLISWFNQLGEITREVLKEKGGILFVDRTPFVRNAEEEAKDKWTEAEIKQLPRAIKKKYSKSGELLAFAFRQQIRKLGYPFNQQLRVEIDTNGYGMTNPASTLEIINELYKQGINNIRISRDLAHKEYISKFPERNIDYNFLEVLISAAYYDRKDHWVQDKLPPGMFFDHVGNGSYALPLGRATGLSLEERVRLAGVPVKKCTKEARKIQRRLSKEFDNWGQILNAPWVIESDNFNKFTHCYCGPAMFYRSAERVMTFSPENRLDRWGIHVLPDLSVNICGLNILSALGDLRGFTQDQLYRRAIGSKLYEILGHEGPQGIARRITTWSEEEIKRKYIERTPCGLCYDFMRDFPEKMEALFKKPSSFGEPREEKTPRGLASRIAAIFGQIF